VGGVDVSIGLIECDGNEQEIFLKTIIPSRKLKKKYLGD
jgi:hypothetical protein